MDLYLPKIREEPEPLNTNLWRLSLRRACVHDPEVSSPEAKEEAGRGNETTE